MTLISQPGSDYRLTEITLDLGCARDIIHLLIDIHGLLAELCLDGARPQVTALAEASLRECDSPYTPDALISALDEVITHLTGAMRDAVLHIQQPARQPSPPHPDQHARPGQAGGKQQAQSSL